MPRISPGLLFVAPALLILIVVMVVPLGISFALSLKGAGGVSLEHYARLFTDATARQVMVFTLQFTVASVAGHLLLGLFLANLLNAKLYLRRVWRMLFLIPWVISPVISGVLWKWMLDPMYGWVNHWLLSAGLIRSPVLWLGSGPMAKISVIVAWIWTGFPFAMTMILAGLQQIPQEQYEAAECDGARGWQKLVYITLPNLKQVMLIAALLDTIQSFRAFSSIHVMTGGGPGIATSVASIFIYRQAFEYLRFEYASAAATGVAVILLTLGLVYLRLLVRHEEAGL